MNEVFQYLKDKNSLMVILTTTQVETLFSELEYLEPRLKVLGVTVADEEVDPCLGYSAVRPLQLTYWIQSFTTRIAFILPSLKI